MDCEKIIDKYDLRKEGLHIHSIRNKPQGAPINDKLLYTIYAELLQKKWYSFKINIEDLIKQKKCLHIDKNCTTFEKICPSCDFYNTSIRPLEEKMKELREVIQPTKDKGENLFMMR